MQTDTVLQVEQSDFLPWRGRRRHAGNTWAWLETTKAQSRQWPNQGLSDQAIVDLVNALPTLAREKPEVFQASAQLLLAQSPDKAWQRAMNVRLELVRRAVENGDRRLKGDQIALKRRNDSWVGTRAEGGTWTLNDGRELAAFIARGKPERGAFWEALTALPGIVEMEVPNKHMGYTAWVEAIDQAQRLLTCQHPAVRRALTSGRAWKLAIRRIKRLGARGLYDQASQTVIVDPRHPETLLHELAHWALEHDHMTEHSQAEDEVEALLGWLEGKQ